MTSRPDYPIGQFVPPSSKLPRWGKRRTTISVREAALIQTFPKGYMFESDHMDYVCDMIGNAVPPKFAQVAGKAIRKELKKRYESVARQ